MSDKIAAVQLTEGATIAERKRIQSMFEDDGYETSINTSGGEIFVFDPDA